MTITHAQAVARRIAHDNPDIDQSLPIWARRSNPIIRRQLGAHWRVFPPQPAPLIKYYLIFAGLILLTIPYAFMFLFVLTMLLAVAMILPSVVYIYFKSLVFVISDASEAITEEFRNDTLTLLRTTPFTGREIVLSKITASIWRRMSDLDIVMSMVAVMGAPPLLLLYIYFWPPETHSGIPQLMAVLTYASYLLRLPLEMFMVASLAAMLGAITRLRSSAFSATVALTFFYYLLINLMRMVPLTWYVQIFVDAVLPLILPVLISFGAVSLTLRFVTRD